MRIRRERIALAVIDGCRGWGDDGRIIPQMELPSCFFFSTVEAVVPRSTRLSPALAYNVEAAEFLLLLRLVASKISLAQVTLRFQCHEARGQGPTLVWTEAAFVPPTLVPNKL